MNREIYKFKSIGVLGAVTSAIMITLLIAYLITVDSQNYSAIAFVVMGLLLVPCLYLTLYGFVRSIELKEYTVVYTNLFGVKHEYNYVEITSIKEHKLGDFEVCVNGKRAFMADHQLPELISELGNRSPQTVKVMTLADIEKSNMVDGVIISVYKPVVRVLVIVFIAAATVPIIFFPDLIVILGPIALFGIVFGLLTFRYRAELDTKTRTLKLRKFFKTKTLNLREYTTSADEDEHGFTIAVKIRDGRKKVAKVYTSIELTNRNLLIKQLLKH